MVERRTKRPARLPTHQPLMPANLHPPAHTLHFQDGKCLVEKEEEIVSSSGKGTKKSQEGMNEQSRGEEE